MPQMRFRVRWPDDSVMSCYSPSLIVKEFFEVGHSYLLSEFVARSKESLTIGSERVKAKFGFYCSSAMDQLQTIEEQAALFESVPDAHVTVEGFEE